MATYQLLSDGKPIATGSNTTMKTLLQQARSLQRLIASGELTEYEVREAIFGCGKLKVEKSQ